MPRDFATIMEEPEAEAPEQSETETTEPEVSTETVETAPKEDPAPAETASDGDSEADHVPDDLAGLKKALAAARGDKRTARKSWQEVEREKAKLEGELAALRRQAQAPAKAPEAQTPDDPDAPFYTEGPAKFWQTREQALKQEFEAKLVERDRRQLDRDRSAMLRAHEDYEEAEKAFVAAAQLDPSLAEKLRASGDAPGFAYEYGKKLIADSEAKLRSKILAELQAKGIDVNASHAPAPTSPAKAPIPPKSIAGSRGSGAGVTQAWSGPRDFKTL